LVIQYLPLITPLYLSLLKELMDRAYLHVDETPIQVLDKDKMLETHRGFTGNLKRKGSENALQYR
jgi:hypothetical protein